MNYTGPKVRISRKLGIAITPKAAKIMQRKPQPPGVRSGGPARRRKASEYKVQLLEKQKLRFQYNIHERQMQNYYAMANRQTGNTGEILVQIMESRLDAQVLRAGFARTIYAARQFVTHGHIIVDGARVNIPSYRLTAGQTFGVREKSRELLPFVEARDDLSATPPLYLDVNRAQLSAKYTRVPERDEIPVICEVHAVVEYYSR